MDYSQCPAGMGYGPGFNGANVDPNQRPVERVPMRGATFEPCRKKNDALKKSGGNIAEYQLWRDRIIDHLCRTNRQWRHILETMQVWSCKITKQWLLAQSHAGFSGWEIAHILEGFLVEHLSDGLYRRRFQLCGGERGNGLEMWRWLVCEFQGMLGGGPFGRKPPTARVASL